MDEAVPTQTTLRLPSPASLTVTPSARVSPAGEFTVELFKVAGFKIDGPTKAQPVLEGVTTVRLPVTASAPLGTPSPTALLATGKLRGTPVANLPLRPVPLRLSRTRAGSSAKKVAPVSSAVK